VALVLLSLVLITAYFREGDSGTLHSAQGNAARVLEPFQVGAERIVRPFDDAWGWFNGLRNARAENTRLKQQLAQARAQAARQYAQSKSQIAGISQYARAPSYVHGDYKLLKADVIVDPLSYQQQVVVSAGRNDGVKVYDPVVSTDGMLLGHISKVASGSSLVTLIDDRSSAVAVVDIDSATNTKGILRGGGPDAGSLIMDQVSKQDAISSSDRIVTAGKLMGGSFYPQGIAVGRVDAVSQSDTDPFTLVHVAPYADLGNLDSVVILLRKQPLPNVP
jgi:rod shape-determining protein MreC